MSYEFFDYDDCNRDDSGPLRRAALLSSVALFLLMGTISAGHAQGVASQSMAFSVPAQPLGSALTRFADQANLRLLVPSNIVAGKTSRPVSGSYAPEAALAQLLAGTGLSFSFSAANTVTVTAGGGAASAVADAGAPAPDGSLVLDTITVRGGQGAVPADAPYEMAAPTANISGQNIERFRGSSPADMFRSTPGVMSGEARNGAGSIDPNIRGMQGFGRVATTIDGAENAATIYQGYQGVSNRTFVDPDFISNIDVNKGADASSWGNAGSIAMTTVGVDDIVKPGKTWGIRVKGEMAGNTSSADAGARSGYLFSNPIGSTNDPTSGFGTATPSSDGMDRPSFLTPTQGSGSVVAAVRQEDFDLVAGYAQRKRGNYHAGTNGPHANPVDLGPQPFCYSSGECPDYLLYRNFVENGGIANYRAGEEVLNTQSATESWLTKLTARIGDDQTLQLGYNGFRSETGDILASRFAGPESQAIQGSETTGTSVDSYTARYRWNPEDNDLIDLKSNVYWTHLEVRNPIRGGRYGAFPIDIGLPSDFRVGSDTDLWGGDISNLSKFSGGYGDLDLTYGLSYRAEDTQGSLHANVLEAWLTPRDAIRQEAAAYTKAAYEPFNWLTLNAGLRYSYFWSKDRFDPYDRNQANYSETGEVTSDGGFSPSVGVTFEPFDGAQFYVNYSNTMRASSIFETVSAFNSVAANADVTPERSSNWEIGTNLTRDGLVADGDRAMVKLGYFNWDVDNYIARSVIVSPSSPLSLQIANIDRAKFSGLEFSGRYENGGFSADLAANYFLNVQYCRTADTCGEASLYGDYATNHVQPEYNVSLTLSQKLFEDRLTLGGRVTRVGPRAIDHGDVTAQGAQAFISPVEWEPYTLVDTFAEYKLSDSLTAAFRVENLFDRFYVDPLSLVTQPGPGRTYYASLTGNFGGDQQLAFLPSFGSGGERTSD